MSHFDDREMIILSQPSNSEKDLRNLDKVDPKKLTHEFNDDREMLMEYIFEQPRGKALQQKKLTVDCLVHLLEESLNGLNKDDNIDFARIWSDYIEDQAKNAVTNAKQKLDEDLKDLYERPEEIRNQDDLIAYLDNFKQQSVDFLDVVKDISQTQEDYDTIY